MGAQYSEGTKMGDNQQQPRSDLDRLTEGKEGREILIVATWLRENGKELTLEQLTCFSAH